MDKIIIVSIIVSIFIYNRTLDYYKVLPRKNYFAAAFVGLWTYVAFKYDIWYVIVGVIFLNFLDRQIAPGNMT